MLFCIIGILFACLLYQQNLFDFSIIMKLSAFSHHAVSTWPFFVNVVLFAEKSDIWFFEKHIEMVFPFHLDCLYTNQLIVRMFFLRAIAHCIFGTFVLRFHVLPSFFIAYLGCKKREFFSYNQGKQCKIMWKSEKTQKMGSALRALIYFFWVDFKNHTVLAFTLIIVMDTRKA